LGAMSGLLDARGNSDDGAESEGEGLRVLRPRISIGGRLHAVSPEARVRPGELIVLSGPSGCGKSTLLREIAEGRLVSVELGYVMQDPSRALPAEMPVHEALGARKPDEQLLRRWFGNGLDEEMLSRPVGALSEGERHRALLAGEVMRLERSAARVHLLLLDEPFGAPGPEAHSRLMDALPSLLRA